MIDGVVVARAELLQRGDVARGDVDLHVAKGRVRRGARRAARAPGANDEHPAGAAAVVSPVIAPWSSAEVDQLQPRQMLAATPQPRLIAHRGRYYRHDHVQSPPRSKRGSADPSTGVPPLLMPAAHALVQAREDAERALGRPDGRSDLAAARRSPRPWASTCGISAGALDRLFTYARGERLSERAAARGSGDRRRARGASGRRRRSCSPICDAAIDRALAQIRATPEATLLEPRGVGRQQLPSTVMGSSSTPPSTRPRTPGRRSRRRASSAGLESGV